jgi:CheY-like chemotaxis protein
VQGPRGLARSEGGLGLGLAIARSLVEMHGGSIHARSDGRGRGSTFTVELPLSSAAATAASPPGGPVARTTRNERRVLVVDDNADAAETLADVLRSSGYEVRTAHEPSAALEAAQAFAPDVAIVDIGLPGMDGWALGRKVRELLAGNPPQCVAVTGYGMETDRARSREAGFVAHLVKPVDVERLERILAGLIAAKDGDAGP